MPTFSSLRARVLALTLVLLFSGCKSRPKTYKVTGRVHRGGEVLKVNQPQVLGRVRVQFVPIGGAGVAGARDAVVDHETGKFAVKGPDGQGLLPGKYRICIYQYDPFPSNDVLQGEFGEAKSPFVREITGDSDFDLDLAKPN